MLVFLVPQLPTGKPQPPVNETRGIHPFFNWHLFSAVHATSTFYGLELRHCKKLGNTKPIDLDHFIAAGTSNPNGILERRRRYVFYRRLDYVATLYKDGQYELVQKGLKHLMRNLSDTTGSCEYLLYQYSLKFSEFSATAAAASKTYVRGPSIVF